MKWAFLFVILFILVIILSFWLIDLEIQIHKITGQLHTALDADRKELITISLGDKSIERLTENINQLIIKENDSILEIKRRENKLKENISCLSHDLRTPLTSIRGYLKLMENASEKERDNYMEVVFKKSLKLESLIDEFYQISLLEDGRYLFEYENIDISELLTEILLENYSLFKEKNIIPEIDLPDQSVLIYADKKACIRIIQNLLFNALEETTGGVQIQLIQTDKTINLTVQNPINNLEIPEPDKLFERFYTRDKSRKNGRSGQGLYVVKKLLAEMKCEEPQVHIADNCFSISVKWKSLEHVL